jgi:hypothetical protein
MKHLLLIFSLIVSSAHAFAQFTGHYDALKITGGQNTLKSEIPLATPSIIGSTYLEDDWQKAEIVLKNGLVIDDFPVKVEIEQANIEIRYNGEVKFLNIKQVDYINLVESHSGKKNIIKKASDFTFNDTPLKGLVMVDSGARYNIVKHFYIEFLQSNYNVAMDVGSKDHRKIKRSKLYLAQGPKLILVKGSNKKIVEQLGQDKENALAIIKTHKLSLSREADLTAFVGLLK